MTHWLVYSDESANPPDGWQRFPVQTELTHTLSFLMNQILGAKALDICSYVNYNSSSSPSIPLSNLNISVARSIVGI